jgi:hypothetical protein
MPMNADVLAGLMKTQMDAVTAALAPGAVIDREATYKALATAVIMHITSQALVTVPALGLISATPGSPVTGVAVGTIT